MPSSGWGCGSPSTRRRRRPAGSSPPWRTSSGPLAAEILDTDQSGEIGIAAQRERVETLRSSLAAMTGGDAAMLAGLADALVETGVWIVGGDGWAYDIGFGGLDHVLASGRNVNILVLDTEVYSNTGGQASKATHGAAVAKFAAGGRATGKKDLGLIAEAYGDIVYVAQGGDGGQHDPGGQGLHRGRSAPRGVADHRLQPVHRPRDRHVAADASSEGGRRVGVLAAVPVRPGSGGCRRSLRSRLDSRAAHPHVP